jgi:hypothetical protein
MPDSALTAEDTPVVTLVLLNDVDVEEGTLLPATLTLFSAPADGSVLVNTLTGQLTYTPDADFYGFDEYVPGLRQRRGLRHRGGSRAHFGRQRSAVGAG